MPDGEESTDTAAPETDAEESTDGEAGEGESQEDERHEMTQNPDNSEEKGSGGCSAGVSEIGVAVIFLAMVCGSSVMVKKREE